MAITLGTSEEDSSTSVTIDIPGIFKRERIEEILEAARKELEKRAEVLG